MTDLGSCRSMVVFIKLTPYVIGSPLIISKTETLFAIYEVCFILEFHLFSVHHNGTKETIKLS